MRIHSPTVKTVSLFRPAVGSDRPRRRWKPVGMETATTEFLDGFPEGHTDISTCSQTATKCNLRFGQRRNRYFYSMKPSRLLVCGIGQGEKTSVRTKVNLSDTFICLCKHVHQTTARLSAWGKYYSAATSRSPYVHIYMISGTQQNVSGTV